MDEVEELAISYEKSFTDNGVTIKADFKAGYNKSQETHPFSEEDMIAFAEWLDENRFSILTINKEWASEILQYSGCVYTTKELLQLWKEQKTKTLYYE